MGNNKYAEFQRELREQLYGTQSDGVPTGPVVLPEALQFGEVVTFVDTVLFDGDVSDREQVLLGEEEGIIYSLVRISEAIPSINDFSNGTTVKLITPTEVEEMAVPKEYLIDTGAAIIVGDMKLGVVIKEDNTYLEGILFPKKGIYTTYASVQGSDYVQYISEIKIHGYNGFKDTAIIPIQNKYLEPFIALNPSDTFVWDFSVAEKDTYFVVGEGVFLNLWEGDILPSDLQKGIKVTVVDNTGLKSCEIAYEDMVDLAGVKMASTTFEEGNLGFWFVSSMTSLVNSIPPGVYIPYGVDTWKSRGCTKLSLTVPGYGKFSPLAVLKTSYLPSDEVVFSFNNLPTDNETAYEVTCNKSFAELMRTYRHRLTDALIKNVRYRSEGGVEVFGNQVYHIYENYVKPKAVSIYTSDANKGGSERECRILLTFEVNESGIDPHTYGIFATFAEPTFKVMRLS